MSGGAGSDDLTALLEGWRAGDRTSGDRLMAAAYDQLRRLAAHCLQGERAAERVDATELVNDLYLKLSSGGASVAWQDRAHFFALAARQIRRILVDHARARHAGKRGGDAVRLSLTAAHGIASRSPIDVLELDLVLGRLQQLDDRVATGVELRVFSGLSETEVAEVLGVSVTTVRRDWKFARAWLVSELGGSAGRGRPR
jgi:RNA polymerase sigma factor (TIGR02999 family)